MPRERVPAAVSRRVVFARKARDDLRGIYLYIADRAGDDRARRYVERIEAYCRGFADFSERGTGRDDLLPGLRVTGFERRVAIAFHIDEETVVFDRLLYGGRDIAKLKPPAPTKG